MKPDEKAETEEKRKAGESMKRGEKMEIVETIRAGENAGEKIAGIKFNLPAYGEIPDVGLYLEQVTKYVAGYVLPMGSFSVTSSMISNYVKKGLVKKPVKKLYYREQIAEIFVIVLAKLVLALEDTRILFKEQEDKEDKENKEEGRLYTRFCENLYDQFERVFEKDRKEEGKEEAKEWESEEEEKKGAVLLSWTARTIVCRVYLEALVDSMKNM